MSDTPNGNGKKLAIGLVVALSTVVVGALYKNDERIEGMVRSAEERIMSRLADDRQERHTNADRIRKHEMLPGHAATTQRVQSLERQVEHLDTVLQREQDLKDDRLRDALEALRREITERITTLAAERDRHATFRWEQIQKEIDSLKKK